MTEKWVNAAGGISSFTPQAVLDHGHTSDLVGAKVLERLPEEMWELVLEKLEDSKDILNFFKAFPQMEGRIMKNAYMWQFDQVVPHIFLLLSKTDMLNCRRVRKSWNFGVTNFIENHLARRAYSRDVIQPTGQRWIPEATQLYSDVDTHFFNMWPSKSFERIPEQILMAIHPPNSNPFIARSIKITETYGNWESFWNQVQTGLRNFGHHIWFLTIHFHSTSNPLHFRQLFEQILTLVPNLKRLSIKLNFPLSRALSKFLESHRMELPALPQLESLEIYLPPFEPIYNILVSRYSQQIRKLKSVPALERRIESFGLFPDQTAALPVVERIGHFSQFPELTELILTECVSTEIVTDIIAQLRAPNLSKLEFGLKDHSSFGIENRIVPLLSRFPHLHSLTISLSRAPKGEKGAGSAHPIHPIPSLQSFCLDGVQMKDMDLDFLRFFPALEYIKVTYRDGNVPVCFNEQNIHEPRIWKLLSHLREVVLEVIGREDIRQYTRARYEARQAANFL